MEGHSSREQEGAAFVQGTGGTIVMEQRERYESRKQEGGKAPSIEQEGGRTFKEQEGGRTFTEQE